MLLNTNWYKLFYWVTAADSIKTIFSVIAIIGLVCVVITTIGFFVSTFSVSENVSRGNPNDPTEQCETYNEWVVWLKAWKRAFTITLPVTIIFGTLWAFIPTKKDCIFIIAGGSVGNFISSDSSAKALPADITKYLHLRINEEIKDLGAEEKSALGIKPTPKEEFMDKVKNLTKEEIIDFIKNDTTLTK